MINSVAEWLWIPICMSIVYGYTQARSKATFKFFSLRLWASWITTALVTACLVIFWSVCGFPLPFFYILIYLSQAVRLLSGRPFQTTNWFMLNLTYANMVALHLTIIGVAALWHEVGMYSLLSSPSWRMFSVCIVLFVTIIEDLCYLQWPNFSRGLVTESESSEAKAFLNFLHFCVIYLTIDATLCMFELEVLYPPLFLIGSATITIFTLIRFLLHIHTLAKHHHFEEEHAQLETRLEAARESTDALNQMTERDVLTNVFSRRYIMEHIDVLISSKSLFSLIYLDLDDLKYINDTQGHDAGDKYLIDFSDALGKHLRKADFLGRVGGDEFIILMPDCTKETASKRIQEIRQNLEQRNESGESMFRFSYGVATSMEDKKDIELLISEADHAMYQDKIQRHRERGLLL